jgi:hypothetical protein
MMKITLSYDHRVTDGAKAAQFMKTLQELMEHPVLILACEEARDKREASHPKISRAI